MKLQNASLTKYLALFRSIIFYNSFGVRDNYPQWLQIKVKLSNSISRLVFLMAIFFLSVTWNLHPPASIIPFLAMPFCILTPVLNRFGLHKLSRVLLAVLPVILSLFFTAILTQSGSHPSFGFWAMALSTLVFPFVLFDYQEKRFLFGTFLTGIIFLSLFQTINARLNVQLPGLVEAETLNAISSAAGIIIIFFSLLFFSYEMRKAYKANLTLLENLQKKNKELDRFAYSTSHELRSPLRTLLGLVVLTHKSKDKAELSDYLMMMEERIEMLDETILKIADYSRNNAIRTEASSLNIRDFLKHLSDDIALANAKKNIKIHLGGVASIKARVDELRLRLIFQNLIANAFNYHDLNKPNPYIKLEARTQGDKLIFSVADNGSGIAKEAQPHIFSMFYRGTQKSNGSGLGLFIVKEAVERLNGEIEFSSALGGGTTFIVSIPYIEDEPSPDFNKQVKYEGFHEIAVSS